MQPPCNLCALLYDETPHQDAQSITLVPMFSDVVEIFTCPE